MPKVTTIAELGLFQRQNDMHRRWGLVPTMGSLHEGHLQLITQAFAENSVTFVTLFVNPTQFDNKGDLDNYPSSIDLDVQKIEEIDPNICVFVPSVETIYPDGAAVKKYALQGLDKPMEGQHRPGHFDGVATVVERLFTLIKPDVAYFGQKDFQQLQIVSLLAQSMGISIRSVATVREANGLAMSSRNSRFIPRAPRRSQTDLRDFAMGSSPIFPLSLLGNSNRWPFKNFLKTQILNLTIFEIAKEHNLRTADSKTEGVAYRAFIAVVVDGVRLIDNMSLN